jgi:CheY-like chemotaxis protein
MRLRSLIRPRLLIVEDDPNQCNLLKSSLESLSLSNGRELGVECFEIDLAGTAEEAEQKLFKATSNPYDLLLLDLAIPVKEIGQPTIPENAHRLLKKVRQRGAAREVMVISAFYEPGQVARSFRGGAIDFLGKPYTIKAFQARILACLRSILLKQSNSLLGEKRINCLVQYAEQALARRFEECFDGLLQEITNTSEDLETFAGEQYGLKRTRDSQDPFFIHLNSLRESAAKSKEKWRDLQASLVGQVEFPRTEMVEEALKEVHQTLLPCFIVKNVTLNCDVGEATEVLSFGDAVKTILREIILGAIAGLPDYNETASVIDVNIKNATGHFEVIFKDKLCSIPAAPAKEINKGTLSSGLPLWFQRSPVDRVWGLSVMQHLALRGAGRLVIKPQARGNIITYYIPAA